MVMISAEVDGLNRTQLMVALLYASVSKKYSSKKWLKKE